MEEKPSAQGQPMNPTCKDLGDLKPVLTVCVEVRVHTKARTDVCANERKDETTRHEDRRT